MTNNDYRQSTISSNCLQGNIRNFFMNILQDIPVAAPGFVP